MNFFQKIIIAVGYAFGFFVISITMFIVIRNLIDKDTGAAATLILAVIFIFWWLRILYNLFGDSKKND